MIHKAQIFLNKETILSDPDNFINPIERGQNIVSDSGNDILIPSHTEKYVDDAESKKRPRAVEKTFEYKLREFIKCMIRSHVNREERLTFDLFYGPHVQYFGLMRTDKDGQLRPDRDVYRVINLLGAVGLVIHSKGRRQHVWTGHLDTSYILRSRSIVGLGDCANLALCVIQTLHKNRMRTFNFELLQKSFHQLIEKHGIPVITKPNTLRRELHYCLDLFTVLGFVERKGKSKKRVYSIKSGQTKKISFYEYLSLENIEI